MIAHVDAISSVLESKQSVLVRHDPFREDRQLGDALDVRNDAPIDSVILMFRYILSEGRLIRIFDLVMLARGLVRCQILQVKMPWQLKSDAHITVSLPQKLRVSGQAHGLVAILSASSPQIRIHCLRLRHVDLEQL